MYTFFTRGHRCSMWATLVARQMSHLYAVSAHTPGISYWTAYSGKNWLEHMWQKKWLLRDCFVAKVFPECLLKETHKTSNRPLIRTHPSLQRILHPVSKGLRRTYTLPCHPGLVSQMATSFQVLRIKCCGSQRGHKLRLAVYTLLTLARLKATVIHCAIWRHVSNAVLFDSECLCTQKGTNFAGYLHVKGGRAPFTVYESDLAPS